MELLIVLACTVAASFALREPLRRFPAVFYLLAVALDALFLAGWAGMLPWGVWSTLLLLVRRCALAFSLFAVVMFIGVFPRKSKVRAWLGAVRGELSVVACIIALGHMAFYLASFASRLFAGGVSAVALQASLVVALALAALLILLGVTSLKSVRARMNPSTWRKVQRLAYLFYALLFAHIALALLPSALSGGEVAAQSAAAYIVVFGAYAVLRIVRAVLDRKEGGARDAVAASDELSVAADASASGEFSEGAAVEA